MFLFTNFAVESKSRDSELLQRLTAPVAVREDPDVFPSTHTAPRNDP